MQHNYILTHSNASWHQRIHCAHTAALLDRRDVGGSDYQNIFNSFKW